MIDKNLYIELYKYLIDPTETTYMNYSTVNIFNHPVYQIFFWKNDYDNTFFSLYKYSDKYITIYDLKGDIYDLFNEDTDEEMLHQIIIYLFKKMEIHNNIEDISFKSCVNNMLIENFTNFSKKLKNTLCV